MNADIDLHGVFVPALLGLACVALVLSLLLQWLLRAAGFYRLVWHAPLFDLAMFVVILGAVAAASQWILA
jgi:hypothetical protein